MGQTAEIEQLKAAGYTNLYQKGNKIFVATEDDKGFKSMRPASEVLAEAKNTASNKSYEIPKKKVSGGQGSQGKHINRQDKASYNKNMDMILNETDLNAQNRKRASERSLVGIKDISNLPIFPDFVQEGIEGLVDDPKFGKLSGHAGRETSKLMEGGADIYDKGTGFLKDMVGMDDSANWERINAREKEQASNDEIFKAYQQESNGSGIAGMAPYLATGGLGGPIAYGTGRALGAVGRGIGRGAGRVAKGTSASTKTSLDALKKQYSKIQPSLPKKLDTAITKSATKLDDKFNQEILQPFRDKVTHIKSRPAIENKFRGKPISEGVGAAALGTIEGGVHYDESMGEGAASSVLGWMGGKGVKGRLSQSPNLNSQSENEIISKWKKLGYRPSPGMETGVPEIQKIVSDARQNYKFASGVKGYDDANLDVISGVVSEAIGMDAKTLRNITPAQMGDHVQGLKKQYNDLEDQTIGIPDEEAFDGFIKGLDYYPENVQKKLSDFHDRMVDGFEGKEYKNIRKDLKKSYDSAYKGNKDEAEAYKDLIDIAEKSLENGMGKDLGPAMVEQWRNLNEKYAMTNFAMENGMDAAGGITPRNIANKLMATDSQRLLTGVGGRIGRFHDIAKISQIEKNQKGGGLGSMNVDSEIDDQAPGLGSTPAVGDMGPVRNARFHGFMKGYPNKTGYLNLPRDGIGNAENLLRANQQGTDTLREVPEAIGDSYEWLKTLLQDTMRGESPKP
jgi:hypothetical protein